MSRKKHNSTAWICVLLCLPLVFIAYFTFLYATEELQTDEIVRIEIVSPTEDKTVFDDEDTISFYVNMFRNGKKLVSPIRDIGQSYHFDVGCDRGDKVLTYRIYPELSETGCMYMSPEGDIYLIDEENAKQLLSKKECASLYSASTLPYMKVVSGRLTTEVLPNGYSWYYKKQNGDFTSYTDSPIAQGSAVCPVYSDRDNSISFGTKPDDVTVTITDKDGKLLPQTDIGSLVFMKDTMLRVTVSAKWNHKSSSNCYGSASYSFDLRYDVPAVLTLSSEEAFIGGMVQIDVRHLNQNEEVVFDSDIIANKPHFTQNGNVMSSVLAISDTAKAGSYPISYRIGDNSGSFTLNISGNERSERKEITRLGLSAEAFSKTLSDEVVAEFNKKVEEVQALLGNVTYESKTFKPPVTIKAKVEYGSKIIVNVDDSTDTHIFYSIGRQYETVENASVFASADGKVIYVGECGFLGKFMVIDHGCGICSWYCNLSKTVREVGTEVSVSSIVGFADASPFNEGFNVFFAISAGNAFVK